MDVGIRDLKQHLSAYLERVAQGEVIRITDRGHPKALLTPIRDDRVIERGLREGWLTRAESSAPARIQRARSRRRVLELLREDRDGR